MDVEIPKRADNVIGQYSQDDVKIAQQFTHELKKEMGKYLKASVLFGSAARKTTTKKSDVDVLILVDDLSIILTRDVADAYRIIIQKIISKVSRRLHVVTLRLTAFWEYIRNGDPVGVNILRDGYAIYDTGFFEPAKLLLKKGRIKPSEESIWAYYLKAPTTLNNAKWHVMQGVVDLYWAVIDAAHAALMAQNVVPPTPEHVADMMEEHLFRKKLLEKKYVDTMRKFYSTAKQIMHREIHEISGKDFDKYMEEATIFVERMKPFIDTKK